MDKRRSFITPLLSCLLLLIPLATSAGGLLDKLSNIELPRNLGGGEPEFLHPDEAFRFNWTLLDGNRVQLEWHIAPGYYLYRGRFKIASDNNALIIALPELPVGEIKDDPEFGRVAIYRDVFSFIAPFEVKQTALASNAGPSTIEVTYQGCAEDGICYPPIKKPLSLANDQLIGGANTGPTASPAADEPAGITQSMSAGGVLSADSIATQLGNQGLLSVISLFFGFGLLLSFTPCVFPMIPILSGIIVGHKQPLSTIKAFWLSLVYVTAMALTYAVIGVIAGLFGHNLQATFQMPAVIIAFSAIFVLLALSMFGFYELQLPTAWQTRLDRLSRSRSGGSYSGVAVMGLLSAIIVGPCVAPPLAGALLYISHQGSALIGGLALFAMGLGMGALLLAVGTTAGKVLPRSGRWMESVKRFFGVLLLGVAIWFLARILPGPIIMALWAVLLIVTAVFLGALESSPPTDGTNAAQFLSRFQKGLGLFMLVYGAVLIVGAGAGATDPLRPLETLVASHRADTNSKLEFTAIKSNQDLDQAIEVARQNGQMVMLDFYADWCIECKHLEKQTFSNKTVQAALAKTMLLRADVTANDPVDQALLKRFELFGPPAVLFFAPDGMELRRQRILGFVGPKDFSSHLTGIDRS